VDRANVDRLSLRATGAAAAALMAQGDDHRKILAPNGSVASANKRKGSPCQQDGDPYFLKETVMVILKLAQQQWDAYSRTFQRISGIMSIL